VLFSDVGYIMARMSYEFIFLPEGEDDWFDYRLELDPRFLEHIESARKSLRAGRGVRFEDIQ